MNIYRFLILCIIAICFLLMIERYDCNISTAYFFLSIDYNIHECEINCIRYTFFLTPEHYLYKFHKNKK